MSDYVPEEEILKRLPAKTLLRCRCVCKSWKKTIDSPFFAQQHLAVQNRRLIVKYEEPELLVLDPCTLPLVGTLSLPLAFEETLTDTVDPFSLVGTLHGVVCLFDRLNSFLIWNPSIRKSSVVPLPALDFVWDDTDVKDLSCFGFWIDPSGKHFKIIVFREVCDDDGDGVEHLDGILYSSIHQEWKSLPQDELLDSKHCAESPPVMIDGVAYWIAEGSEFQNMFMLSFDFVGEYFDIIDVPDDVQTRYNGIFHPTLCNLQDTLALVFWELCEYGRCDVLIWDEDEAIWIDLFAFDLWDTGYRVLAVMGETEATRRVIAGNGEDLVLFDPDDRVDLKSELQNYACSISVAYDFKESLLFP